VHNGVRVHPDILRGQGARAAWHPETADQAEDPEVREGGGERVDDGAEPVGRVADDQLHHATAASAGRRRYGGGVAAGRVPVAAGHAGERRAAGDRLRLRERREHQRREQGRRQGHAEGVHHAGQPPADGER